MKNGFLITFEGIEGCGKTTQAQKLYEYFIEKKYDVILTYEPGATKIGKSIREILLSIKNSNIDSYTEFFLYLADRTQHLFEIIYPNYKEGKIIICDRYYYSTAVYQGIARNIGLKNVELFHSIMPFFIKPDLTFIIDVSVEESTKRTAARIKERNENDLIRFESEAKSFHEKLRHGYLEVAKKDPSRIILIDGMREVEKITEDIIKNIKNFGIIKDEH
jgi:dTMP kinase